MKKKFIKLLIITIFILLVIFLLTLIGNPKSPIILNKPILLYFNEGVDSPIDVYNYQNKILYFKPWALYLSYGISDRVMGTNKYRESISLNGKEYILQNLEDKILISSKNLSKTTGFFFKEEDSRLIDTKKINNLEMNTISYYNKSKNPSKINLIITIKRGKKYFKINSFCECKNKNLKEFGYGLYLNNYDVLTTEGKILKNDRVVKKTYLHKDIILEDKPSNITNPTISELQKSKIIVNGSSYDIKPIKPYQILHNYEKNIAVIIYANKLNEIENRFRWSLFTFWISEKENENTFAPLYIAILNDAKLEWKNNTWIIQSKEFNGDVETLIRDWKF